MMYQRIWWKGYKGERSAPFTRACALCDHQTGQHDERKLFLVLDGKIIGRKRVFFCQHCDCSPVTYLELIERPEESTLWEFVSEQPEFKEYTKVTISAPELAEIKQLYQKPPATP